jgi:DNA polymerase-3 subunit beta
MKATVNRAELARAASVAVRGLADQSSIPVLTCMRLQIEEGRLTLTGTDLNRTLQSSCDVGEWEAGELAVPGDTFMAIVKGLAGDNVELLFLADEAKLQVKGGRSKYRVPALTKVEEFPALPAVESGATFSLPSLALATALSRVLPAVGADDTRPVITGLLLQVPAGGAELRVVATDTHRLHITRVPLDGSLDGSAEAIEALAGAKVIVPGTAGSELVKLLAGSGDECMVEVGANQAAFYGSWGVLYTRLIEGVFPNYERVLPDNYTQKARFHKKELADAIKRAAMVAEGDARRIVLTSGGDGLTITAQAPEEGSAEELVETLGGNLDPEPQAINYRFMLAAVGAVPNETATFWRGTALQNVLISGDDQNEFIALMSPMQMAGTF